MFPVSRQFFPELEPGVAHFAGGGQTPLPAVAQHAIADFSRRKARGQGGYDDHLVIHEQTRARAAALLGARSEDVAFTGNASDAIARIVQSVDWRPGDNAVMSELDYASGRAALLRLAGRGVDLLQVTAPGWICSEEALIAACDARTRLVYVTQVNPRTGQRMDVARIHEALAPRGVLVLNDATHALCALPVRAQDADFTVSSCYKFVMASYLGLLCTGSNAARSLVPAGAGWHSLGAGDAQRWEYGNVPHLDVAILHAVLDWQAGLGDPLAREAHLMNVAQSIETLLTNAGFGIVPRAQGRGSHNVCVMTGPIDELASQLEAHGVRVWIDPGRLRFSAQIFNDSSDLDRLDAALETILPKLDMKG